MDTTISIIDILIVFVLPFMLLFSFIGLTMFIGTRNTRVDGQAGKAPVSKAGIRGSSPRRPANKQFLSALLELLAFPFLYVFWYIWYNPVFTVFFRFGKK